VNLFANPPPYRVPVLESESVWGFGGGREAGVRSSIFNAVRLGASARTIMPVFNGNGL
jgi:hypothetical protein